MKKIYGKLVNHTKMIITVFAVLFVICLFCRQFVTVNYDMNDYLPEESPSTVALDVMGEEFEGGIPNARVMIYDVTIPEALEYKVQLAAIEGVTDVVWLDDTVSITQPLEVQDKGVTESYYKDGAALFSLTIEEEGLVETVERVRELIGDENAMTGAAASTAAATTSTVNEVGQIAVIAVLFVLFILLLTTTSWVEPFIVLGGLGLAVVINAGSNVISGEISFVTNAAGSILQLAVSLDYSVFLLHRFTECRKEETDAKKAMVEALCKSTSSILSSGLTTVIGFLALCLMRFKIGPDLGFALAKGVAISLITVFVFSPALILSTYKLIDKTKHRSFMPDFTKLGKTVTKIMLPMVCLFAVLIVPAYMASNSNDYYYGASRIFDEDTKLGADTAAIEAQFGKSDTYVLLVPRGSLATERELSDRLHTIPQVTDIISYVDNAGPEVPAEYVESSVLSKLVSNDYSRLVLEMETDYEGEETFRLVGEIRSIAEEYYPGSYYLAGEGVSTFDLMDTITSDMVKVNLIAIGAVFLVLLLTMKSVLKPVILVLSIETAIWINLSIPYFSNSTIFYIAYLIISSIQLGATVDYAILFTDRFEELRKDMDKKNAIIQTISAVTTSILTSGITLTVVGFLLGIISTHGLLSQLGYFLGKGTLCSLVIVMFVLPGLLYLFSKSDSSVKADQKNARRIKMKMKKVIPGILVISILTGTMPVQATDLSSEKEEVIYVMTDAKGAVNGIYVVNIFEGDKITDYGDYSDTRMLTTNDEIIKDGDKISFTTSAKKVYYQGTLESQQSPWNINLRYFLDGEEYQPELIAGKSGKLEIQFKITENAAYDGTFYDNYALQAAITLDTERCSHIMAKGATQANVGSDKQLSYTILPGKGIDTKITADVTDFEMVPVTINGVQLNMDVEIDDEELIDKVNELIDGVTKLDDGALELNDGAVKLKDGSTTLNNGASSLNSGITSLDNGVRTLQTGITEVQNGLNNLAAESDTLVDGSAAVKTALETIQTSLSYVSVDTKQLAGLDQASLDIKTGIAGLNEGITAVSGNLGYEQYKALLNQNGLDVDTLMAGNAQAAAELTSQVTNLQAALETIQGIPGYEAQTAELTAQIGALQNVITLLGGNNAALGATATYLNGFAEPLGQLSSGASSLNENYETFHTAVTTLTGTVGTMAESLRALSNGINELVKQYGTLDKGIGTYTEGVSSLKDGYAKIVTGVSGLTEGVRELSKGSEELYAGASALHDGMSEFCEGAGELTEGTGQMREETTDMDKQVEDEIDEVIKTLQGGDDEVVSFVSDKNKKVDSVQFVIKSEAIEVPEVTQVAEEPKAERSFWQNLKGLFSSE